MAMEISELILMSVCVFTISLTQFVSPLVDFVKYFRTGDQNQDREMAYSPFDVLNVHVGRETSESIVGEDKNCNENTATATTFPVDMEIDIRKSPEILNSERLGDQVHTIDRNDVESCCNVDLEGTGLSSEVSAIYLAMKNSKLECVDEHGQDSMSTDVYVEDEQYEEFDDFDPYVFIKNLPDLASVVPTFRPMLLPKQTRSCPPTTLVLDLDGKRMKIAVYNLSISYLIKIFLSISSFLSGDRCIWCPVSVFIFLLVS